MEQRAYIEQRNGGYRVAARRVSSGSVVDAVVNGETAGSIADSFPLLRREQGYGASAASLAPVTAIEPGRWTVSLEAR